MSQNSQNFIQEENRKYGKTLSVNYCTLIYILFQNLVVYMFSFISTSVNNCLPKDNGNQPKFNGCLPSSRNVDIHQDIIVAKSIKRHNPKLFTDTSKCYVELTDLEG